MLRVQRWTILFSEPLLIHKPLSSPEAYRMCWCENVHTHTTLTSGADRNSRDNYPGGSVVKNLPAMQEAHRRHGFDPWVGKTLWRKKWQAAPVFLAGKFHRQSSLVGLQFMDGITKSQTWLSMHEHSIPLSTPTRHLKNRCNGSHLTAAASTASPAHGAESHPRNTH